jgi:hypothetical protein
MKHSLTVLIVFFCFVSAIEAQSKERNESMGKILYVRAKSNLSPQELENKLLERKPRFLEVPGLVQKIYGKDESTGEVCGIYFFEDQKALEDYKKTDLAKTIAAAYEVEEIRIEMYDMLYPLYTDRGPIIEK